MDENYNVREITQKFMMDFTKREQEKRIKNYRYLNQYVRKGAILFTGSSLMEQFPVYEFCAEEFQGKLVYNRGIGGFTTDDFLKNIDVMLLDLQPSVVFINIGTNDMNAVEGREDIWMEHLLENYEKILKVAKEKLPETRFFLMAYYPVNPSVPGIAPPCFYTKVPYKRQFIKSQ